MRIRFLCCCSALLLCLTAGAARASDTWALVVGVSEYRTPRISPLRFAAADAQAFHAALIDPQLGGLPADHVKLLVDEEATRANITGSVDTFFKPRVKPGDRVVLFLAGHGVAKGIGLNARSYLLPYDVKGFEKRAVEASAVDLQALTDHLGQLPASQFILFADACREDPTPGRGIKENPLTDVLSRGLQVIPQEPGRSSVTFFSCDLGERAFEDPRLRHGVFTFWILEGIERGGVPQPPDGSVDMGRLAGYVRSRVEAWAQEATSVGDSVVTQSPVMVSTEVDGPVVLMRVRRASPGGSPEADPTRLTIATMPEGARITVDGHPIGTAPVTEELKAGEYAVRAEAPGYRLLERSIRVSAGAQQQVTLRLEPAAAGNGVGDKAAGFFARGVQAETRRQWEVAEAGYVAATEAEPALATGYERLADLHLRQGRNRDTIRALLRMLGHAPPTAHGLSRLARAYAVFAQYGPGEAGAEATPEPHAGEFHLPGDRKEAGDLARRAAAAAVQADPESVEALLAAGFAFLAADRDGGSKREALAAFGKALLLEPHAPEALYGLGRGIRFYAQAERDPEKQAPELRRAVDLLGEAVQRRPTSFDAHRELAFCYHLLGETASARSEYERAGACRGAAVDAGEVGALSLALADLYGKAAATAAGEKKEQYRAAAAGFLADAGEVAPGLRSALDALEAAGLKSRLDVPTLGLGSGVTSPDTSSERPPSRPDKSVAPAAPESLDVDRFDLSGFPKQPTNFEEQQVLEEIRSATNPAFKAMAHERLARYYERRGDTKRTESERAKALYWRER